MPYTITTTIDIDAGRGAVRDVLVDSPAYGEWSNFSRAEGVARPGSRLTMPRR